MKNKYYVISKIGELFSPKEYLESNDCSAEMQICLRREVFEEKWEVDAEPQYIKIANKLGFSWENNAQKGFINYNYKADLIKRLVEGYARNLIHEIGMPIYEVRGSNFFDLKHPVVQAYADLFGDRLFQSSKMVLSYDASYPQFNLAGNMNLKEDSFPFAHFSISDCYRNEQSGECMLLYRNRRFFMPDFHPYFKDVDQAWEWYPRIEKQLSRSFALAGRKYLNIAKISSEKNWDIYGKYVVNMAKQNNREILVEIKMDGAEKYWIVDIDYGIIDQFEQFREIGCIQIDIENAQRLGIKYLSSDGKEKHPVIIHSAIPGGIERYIYMLIDNVAQFPIDFQPIQIRIIPVSEKFLNQALKLVKNNSDIRIDVDDRSESVSKRIKMAHNEGIHNVLVFGEKEIASGLNIPMIHDVREKLDRLVPFIPIGFPVRVGERVG